MEINIPRMRLLIGLVLILFGRIAHPDEAGDLLFAASFDRGLVPDQAGNPEVTASDRLTPVEGRRGGGLWVRPNEWIRYFIDGNLELEAGTLSLWIKPHYDPPNFRPDFGERRQGLFAMRIRTGQVFELFLVNDHEPHLLLETANGNGEFGKGEPTRLTWPTADWRAGQWHQVVVSWRQPGSLSLRVGDGEAVRTEHAALPQLPEKMFLDLYIGSNSLGSAHGRMEHLDATLDDLRIYDVWQREPDLILPPPMPEVGVLEGATTGPRWVGHNRHRVNYYVGPTRLDWERTPVKIEVDPGEGFTRLDAAGRRAAIDSLRLVQFDLTTGEPVVWNPETSDAKRYFHPFQVDDEWYWQGKGTLRWVHTGGGAAGYSLYYDATAPYDAPCPRQIPMVGNGERLRIGMKGDVNRLSVGAWGVFDSGDIDGDGDADLWMNSGFQTRANYHLMNGHYYFENLGETERGPAFAPPQLIYRGNTPYGYLSGHQPPCLADVNQDGQLDLFMCGPRPRDVHEWWQWDLRGGRPELTSFHPLVFTGGASKGGRSILYDWDKDGLPDMLVGDTAYPNVGEKGSPVFNIGKPIRVPINPEFNSDSTSFYLPVDWDGDGDDDLISTTRFGELYFHENTATALEPDYAGASRITTFDEHEVFIPGQLIHIDAIDWDGDGDLDLLWGGENGHMGLLRNIAAPGEFPRLRQSVMLQQQRPVLDVGTIAIPVATDWDDDGDHDLIIGASDAFLHYYENIGSDRAPVLDFPRYMTAANTRIELRPGPLGSVQMAKERDWGYLNPEVADWDGDGLKDLLVTGNRMVQHFFRNIGRPGRPKLAAPVLIEVDFGQGKRPVPPGIRYTPQGNELITVHRSRPCALDWDGDGLTDYIAMDHDHKLALYRRKRLPDGSLALAPGERIFDIHDPYERAITWNRRPREHWGRTGHAGRTVIDFVDWDRDGDLDMIRDNINGRLFENVGGRAEYVRLEDRGDLVRERLANHNTGPCVVDWDGDGWHDLLVGAESGRVFYFHRAYIENDEPSVAEISRQHRSN